MSDAGFLALLVLFPIVGIASRSWLAILAPAVGWPVFYLGVGQGWWGWGTSDAGDAWGVAFLVTLFGVGTTALAVGVGRALRRSPNKRVRSQRT